MDAHRLAQVPPEVLRQAEEMTPSLPAEPVELGSRRIETPRYVIFATPLPSLTFVDRLRIEPDEVAAIVGEVRRTLVEMGRSQAAWCVGPSTQPADLRDRLVELDMMPYEDPPLGPVGTAMAIVEPPRVGDVSAIRVEMVRTIETSRQAADVQAEAAGMSESDRRGLPSALETRLRFQGEERTQRREWIAFVDDVPVGAGGGWLLDHGITLAGAAVLPAARGRGVYRALILHRWNEAVARGTPALTVQAGSMSAPILRDLGFVEVARIEHFCDRF